eukprot:m.234710 g.234710  ORF g.234710 m.234710 type:complete len:327 (+) comp19730_c0_seq1:117-1097(+)
MLALLLLFAAAAAIDHDPPGYTYHEHTIVQPYDQAHDLAHWAFLGSTVVSAEYIRLTPDRQSRRGALWSIVPFGPAPIPEVPDSDKYPPWEAVLEFRVHGSGRKLFGDGFAFWYTKTHSIEGPVFGNQDNFEGLAIFFDTYSNLQQGHQQYISVMINDGTQSYDHSKDGGDFKLAGCPIEFRGKEHNVFARIVYQDNLLRMYVDTTDSEWQECFIIRSVHLPRANYFGVTAATGDLADNHDIISIKIAEPVPMDPQEKSEIERRIAEDVRDHVEALPHHDPQYEHAAPEETPGYVLAFAIFVLVVIAAAAVYLTAREQRRANTHFT